MRVLENILTAVLLCFSLFAALSTAHIISLKLRSDNRHMIPFSDFEFSNAGYVSFVISSVTVTSNSNLSRPDPSLIGFFLQSRMLIDQEPFDFLLNTSICALYFKNTSALFTFQNLSNNPQFSFNNSFPVTYSGMKLLFFVNCNKESLVTLEGRAEFYNIDDGTTKNYLSPGLTQLPFLYFIFSFNYLNFIGVWMLICLKNKRSFNRTHLLMGLLLVMNILHFICVAADLRYVKATGNSDLWDALFRISRAMRAVLLFSVIMLIGVGWCFWKPVLEIQDKLVLITVILLQVLANLDPIMPWVAAVPYNDEDSSYAELICCSVIFIPMWCSHISLEEISEINLNANRNLKKLSFFMGLVFAYVIISKAYIIEISHTRWANNVGQETSLLVLCVVIFYMFRPVDRKRLNEFSSPV